MAVKQNTLHDKSLRRLALSLVTLLPDDHGDAVKGRFLYAELGRGIPRSQRPHRCCQASYRVRRLVELVTHTTLVGRGLGETRRPFLFREVRCPQVPSAASIAPVQRRSGHAASRKTDHSNDARLYRPDRDALARSRMILREISDVAGVPTTKDQGTVPGHSLTVPLRVGRIPVISKTAITRGITYCCKTVPPAGLSEEAIASGPKLRSLFGLSLSTSAWST
jgi:hypothetical protein